MTFIGNSQFVVDLTQHGAVFQAELVALIEGRVAHRTREAVHVEHQVTRAHHHFGEQDGGLAPGATLHPEQPEAEQRHFMHYKCTTNALQMHYKCTTNAPKITSSFTFTQPHQLIIFKREIHPNYYLDKLLSNGK